MILKMLKTNATILCKNKVSKPKHINLPRKCYKSIVFPNNLFVFGYSSWFFWTIAFSSNQTKRQQTFREWIKCEGILIFLNKSKCHLKLPASNFSSRLNSYFYLLQRTFGKIPAVCRLNISRRIFINDHLNGFSYHLSRNYPDFQSKKIVQSNSTFSAAGRHKTQFSFLFGKPTVDKHPTGKKEVYKCRG